MCRCLSDYVVPKGCSRLDFCGGFVVTAGHEVEAYATTFREQGDDYSAIVIQALGDRLAEAAAEYLHKIMRDQCGIGREEGFAADTAIDEEQAKYLIREKYRGIRPAAGYPSCPDHSEKQTLWKLLDVAENTGIELTETCAMLPAAAVSGLYFGHPDSRYFALGRIDRDQVEDYARRKGETPAAVEKWLGQNLSYNPD